MAFIDEVKSYCGAEDVDNEEIQPYIDSSEVYLSGAGIDKDESNALYALAVKMLVSWWYDQRVPAAETNSAPQPYGMNGIILQLQLAQEATG